MMQMEKRKREVENWEKEEKKERMIRKKQDTKKRP